jgi:hypothetical protein
LVLRIADPLTDHDWIVLRAEFEAGLFEMNISGKALLKERTVTSKYNATVTGIGREFWRSALRGYTDCAHNCDYAFVQRFADLAIVHGNCLGATEFLATTVPAAILLGRNSDFAQAIARPLPRSSPCVRDSRRPDRGRFCRD